MIPSAETRRLSLSDHRPAHKISDSPAAGLVPVDRAVARLGRLTDNDIVAHSSFFQRDFVLKNRDQGLPLALIAHEDVLIFRAGQKCLGSRSVLAARPFQHASAPGALSAWDIGPHTGNRAA
jgi:hypothetical protein